MWVIGEAFGSGAGGQLIDHFPIRSVLYGASGLPLLSAALVILVFRGYTDTHGSRSSTEPVEATPTSQTSVVRVMVVTAAVVLLFQVGAGGELALLPLLVTSHLNLSAASAGTAMFTVRVAGAGLLVPGELASDR